MRAPLSTYRLQFGRGFGFVEARELVPYLSRLGITDVYASPIFQAHSESGYDIVDPTRLSDALGSWEEFTAFGRELHRHDMGLVLDIVPNHMAAHSSNRWWRDVLENGPSSPYASYFDIEWDPPSQVRSGKILWPILGAPYSEALERQELVLAFSEEGFSIRYFDRSLPIDPVTYGAILAHMQGNVASEMAPIESLIQSLPPSTATEPVEGSIRCRDSRELKRRLWKLYASGESIRERIEECLRIFNGEAEDPRSFDLLDNLLGQQPYVLSFWRVAREKINYRRFFNISGLVGANVEELEVFAATHALVFQLVDEGWVTGLRIDHIDGLYDPAEYLRRLRERLPECYIVVEKVLERNETLSQEWPVSGTTGYDFLDAVGGVMVDSEGLERLTKAYVQTTGGEGALEDVVYEQKKRAVERLFAGEALSLSLHLNLLAEQDRYAKDASPQGLYAALMEVTACLPVYRTYTRSFQMRAHDLLHIDEAFHAARRRNPQVSETIWNFVRRVLVLDCPPGLSAEQRAGWKQFVQRWQQFSGPAMAKGKEDTAFYIYNRLISMNEVGGEGRPWPVGEFHRFQESRARCWPHSLSAGTTHDTKRGEDVRARIHELAGIPEVWEGCVKRWRRWNARCKRVVNGVSVPGPNEEYFIYQTLVGAWPLDSSEEEAFLERVQNALVKSWREASLTTSWSNPDTNYEAAVADFVATILAPASENRFLPDLMRLQRRVAAYGAYDSLSQTVIRLAGAGVPDIYQGAECWQLLLVDPDNRRPVDFAKCEALLAEQGNGKISSLLKNWRTGAVKQYVIQRTLSCRRDHADVFRSGEYIPIEASGQHADRAIAFARHSGMAWVVAVAPRCVARLSRRAGPPIGKRIWTDTELSFPTTAPRLWSNCFTGDEVEVQGQHRVAMADILRRFPVALLTALPD